MYQSLREHLHKGVIVLTMPAANSFRCLSACLPLPLWQCRLPWSSEHVHAIGAELGKRVAPGVPPAVVALPLVAAVAPPVVRAVVVVIAVAFVVVDVGLQQVVAPLRRRHILCKGQASSEVTHRSIHFYTVSAMLLKSLLWCIVESSQYLLS